MKSTTKYSNSKFTLVGAGPGDIDLITIKGKNAIASADVILYDALANEAMLQWAKPTAILIYVGKRLGSYVYTQTQINELIVSMAVHGQVVRLKGGDSFVFGRGYEEMEYAQGFGITCEVIPGLSSSIAVPASVGIPVTSRNVADSFWVLTGTTKTGELASDLSLAAQSNATVVILMGMSRLQTICDIFEKYGRGATPMAIIQNGTKQEAKVALATVANMPSESEKLGMSNPAIIMIGEVVSLHANYPSFQELFQEVPQLSGLL
jgi:uroporphyrin-III C-methyltransferase